MRFLIRASTGLFLDFEDSDSGCSEWMGGHPDAPRPSGMWRGWAPELLACRISHRRAIRLNLTSPSPKQIGFERQVNYSGRTDFAAMDAVTLSIIQKPMVPPAPTTPYYHEPDGAKDGSVTDATQISQIPTTPYMADRADSPDRVRSLPFGQCALLEPESMGCKAPIWMTRSPGRLAALA